MTTELNKKTKFILSVETLITIGTTLVAITAMYFTLQAEITEAKELPVQDVTRIEFDMKDELVRQTIMNTQDDIIEMKEDIKLIKQKLYE
jgi:hypothetical protein